MVPELSCRHQEDGTGKREKWYGRLKYEFLQFPLILICQSMIAAYLTYAYTPFFH